MSAAPEVGAGMAKVTAPADRLMDRPVGRRPRARCRTVKHAVVLVHCWSSLCWLHQTRPLTGRPEEEPG
jgi:hypothetical protein